MISSETISQAVRTLAKEAQPCKIILFGSYARGEATPDSDVDLLVIEPEILHKRDEMVRLRKVLRPMRIPVDVVVASKQEIDDWGHLPGTIYYWALKEGKTLHETTP
ncbi:MAG: nucleotidyltransferase domain-containing protein [Nitrospirota bacterium]|nr:nucleotidyltransferase domain-containing protein [Nitrospirota bacterium]MDH5775593.1 nucleotidyltransferase domain-containing protein [Nitrospirota bacterium]